MAQTAPTGPAFATASCDGMTLRDWFAGMALQGLLAAERDGYEFGNTPERPREVVAAEAAVRQADAILKALA